MACMSMLRFIDSGLSPDDVRELVGTFYDRIQVHPVLGPIFNDVVEDWDEHKARLTSFWCSVALGARSYRGNPLAKHQPLPIDSDHFQQWLALWQQTTRDVLAPEVAEQMLGYAQRIARGMQMGMGLQTRPQNDFGIPVMPAPVRAETDAG